jgi:hypothetical protein
MDYLTMTIQELEELNTQISTQRDELLEQQKAIAAELETRKLLDGLTPEAITLLRSKLG